MVPECYRLASRSGGTLSCRCETCLRDRLHRPYTCRSIGSRNNKQQLVVEPCQLVRACWMHRRPDSMAGETRAPAWHGPTVHAACLSSNRDSGDIHHRVAAARRDGDRRPAGRHRQPGGMHPRVPRARLRVPTQPAVSARHWDEPAKGAKQPICEAETELLLALRRYTALRI